MSIGDIFNTFSEVPTLLKLKKGMKPRPNDTRDSLLLCVQRNADQFGSQTAVIFEGTTCTWKELNDKSNQYARVLQNTGIGAGDVVSMMVENRTEFLITVVAIMKLGAIAALINTNLRENPLRHCVTVTESKICVFGTELTQAIDEVRDDLHLQGQDAFFAIPDGDDSKVPEWANNLDVASSNLDTNNLPETDDITLGSTAMYIFTSGTTGLPKAAIMSHQRLYASASLSHIAGLKCSNEDRIYLALPLYHGTGLVIGAGSAFSSGASMFLRRRFSASQFLSEVRENKITCMIYVGELCRYLFNSPEQSDDADTPLTNLMGNGLRPDIWIDFKRRYGIKRIVEFYGASEGNAAFANVFNKDKTIGMTSAVVALAQYDIDADEVIRNTDGFCVKVPEGESGLCLAQINEISKFEGYTNPEATEKKILRNVFEDGDAWFNTGDLLRTVDVGYTLGYEHYQFVDRVGDTFRWRSENVSTNEVGEIINSYPQVELSNVYGVHVPGADGRAGMVSINLKQDEASLELDKFADYVNRELPPFARPVFVRIQSQIDVTGTFKMVKKDLVEQNYDLNQFDDPVYVMKPRTSVYVPLDQAFLDSIKSGDAGF